MLLISKHIFLIYQIFFLSMYNIEKRRRKIEIRLGVLLEYLLKCLLNFVYRFLKCFFFFFF